MRRVGLRPARLGPLRLRRGGRIATAGERGGGAFLRGLFADARQYVEAAFGADLTADPDTWSWTDITHYVMWDVGVDIAIGYANEALGLTPASFNAVLRNDQPNGGDFTINNLLGRFWPNIRKNTPIRARLDVGNGPSIRFSGYATNWKPKRGPNNKFLFVNLKANGVSRRLRQGQSARFSPMYRFHMLAYKFPTSTNLGWPSGDQRYHTLPAQYWPFEESSGAVQGSNAINPAYPFVATNADAVPQFGGDTYLVGTRGLARFNDGASMQATFPMVTPGGRVDNDDPAGQQGVRVQFALRIDEGAKQGLISALGPSLGSPTAHLFTVYTNTTGLLAKVSCFLDATSTDGLLLYLNMTNANGIALTGSNLGGEIGLPFERGLYVTIDLVQVGADVEVRFGYVRATSDPTNAFADSSIVSLYDVQTFASTTLRGVTGIILGATANSGGAAIGQIAIYNGPDDTFPSRFPAALVGRSGDTVAERLERLGVESDVEINIVGDPTDIVMGPQGTKGLLELIDEAVKVDNGLLLDGLGPGYTYIARTAAYSQSASLTLDTARSDAIDAEPDDPDQGIVNDYTASSPAAGQQQFVQVDGDLGTAAVGTYDDGNEHPVAFSGDLYQIAAWRVAQGTVPGLRYPQLGFNLAKTATSRLAQQWLDSLPFDRVDALGIDAGTDRRLLLRGWQERWNSLSWPVTLNVTAYDIFAVSQLAADSGDTSASLGWLETDGSTTQDAIAAGATSVVVLTPSGPVWTNATTPSPNYADDITGLYINLDGMHVGVAAIVGATSPQTFTINGADVLRAVPPGASVSVWDPVIIGL